jgi:hypothetical protein
MGRYYDVITLPFITHEPKKKTLLQTVRAELKASRRKQCHKLIVIATRILICHLFSPVQIHNVDPRFGILLLVHTCIYLTLSL